MVGIRGARNHGWYPRRPPARLTYYLLEHARSFVQGASWYYGGDRCSPGQLCWSEQCPPRQALCLYYLQSGIHDNTCAQLAGYLRQSLDSRFL